MYTNDKLKNSLIAAVVIIILEAVTILIVYSSQNQMPSNNKNCDDSTVIEEIAVDLKGEVVSPGVYYLNTNSRLIDLIDEAGGLTPMANEQVINLAKPLTDGMLIVIPNENSQSPSHGNDLDKVSINYGSLNDLMSLNGIGSAKAQAIIDYRDTMGLFTELKNITRVSGIGEATFANIKDDISL